MPRWLIILLLWQGSLALATDRYFVAMDCGPGLVYLAQWPRVAGNMPSEDAGKFAAGTSHVLALTTPRGHTIELWSRTSGKRIETLVGHTAPVTSLSFHPDLSILASAAEDGKAFIWYHSGRVSAATRTLVASVFSAVSVEFGGSFLAVAEGERGVSLQLVRMRSTEETIRTEVNFAELNLRPVNAEGVMAFLDLEAAEVHRINQPARLVEFSSNHSFLGIANKTLATTLSLKTGAARPKPVSQFEARFPDEKGDLKAEISALAITPSGEYTIAARTDGWVFVYNNTAGKTMTAFKENAKPMPPTQVVHPFFYRDDPRLAAPSTINESILSLQASEDPGLLTTVSADGAIRLYALKPVRPGDRLTLLHTTRIGLHTLHFIPATESGFDVL